MKIISESLAKSIIYDTENEFCSAIENNEQENISKIDLIRWIDTLCIEITDRIYSESEVVEVIGVKPKK